LKAIVTRNLRKVYKTGEIEVEALAGVDLDVDEGDFVLVSGPSGSGKTTLLNVLGALDRPTSGQVTVLGRDVSDLSDDELSDLRLRTIGFVFQSYNLIPTLTAYENIEFPMVLSGKTENERREKVEDLLGLVGLENRGRNKPDQLSGGEQQRIAVARALANDPKIILADEPTGNLDTRSSTKVFSLLREVNEELFVTIITVSHDPKFLQHCRRGVVIVDGRVTDQGPAASWGGVAG
jgi:putative ABC transport system ATP-binding protein